SALTVPTTRYRTRRGLPAGVVPAGRADAAASHPHPPLAVMLVLTQLSVGSFAADLVLRAFAGRAVADTLRPDNAVVALALGLLALGASVGHLGRPAYAWRAMIGLRHSWLSREIAAFSAFAALAFAYAGVLRFGPTGSGAADLLGLAVVTSGAAGVACSVRLYAVTGRVWWRARTTAPRFALTCVVAGLATTLAVSLVTAALRGGAPGDLVAAEVGVPLALSLTLATTVKLSWEALGLWAGRRRSSPLAASVRLLVGPGLRRITHTRFALGTLGGLVAPLAVVAAAASPNPPMAAAAAAAVLGAVALTAGELCERAGFFGAVTSPGMPRPLP
ncbi:MAG: dimethyl sulfoxide reductase anchor subunit family protein, partial [Acidimicrobiia bacterium]